VLVLAAYFVFRAYTDPTNVKYQVEQQVSRILLYMQQA